MTAMSNILIVDDDDDIRSLLTDFFQRHAHRVTVAKDGTEMFAALAEQTVDIVILDLMLPGEDGFGLCQKLRSKSRVPVIMLTAMTDHTDRVVGLEIGADDYVTKPFDQRELLARVKAVLRRTGEALPARSSDKTRPKLYFGRWCLDVARRELLADDDTLVFLTSGEFDLLLAFVESPQRVLTRDQLLDARGLSAAYDAPFDRTIDVQVSRLRRKLEDDPQNPSIIRTIRNGGYMFTLKVTSR
jgi:two-component system, OmpR family, response regulator